ncbi:hypothetical protein FH972_025707 [Carpinus fangiana]|uniref:Zn(2)-C6 fungal-type domain-containing protein n=1 Tax=Carpinus fangiana TaxID=176857 RepID=A0A5N6L2T1_9ROSI|nr:hypothetical protein FH972_025707 [Carpinus fangiana]
MAPEASARARKVKTGCFTCKARRVKCDEEKPYCRRCSSSGRKCDGYFSTTSLNYERRSEPTAALSILPNGTEQEKKYFRLYHVRTIDSICAYFGSYFWSTLIPQVSIREPSVQHALLALSALHESIALPSGHNQLRLRTSPSTIFAVGHYNKAIALLTSSEGQPSTDIVLLCCVIFVCIEILRGNPKEALAHIHSGLKVLLDLRSKRISGPAEISISSHPSTVKDAVDTMFARLDGQAMFLGVAPQLTLSPPNSSHPNAALNPTSTGMPSTFANLPEARAHLETLINSIYRFMRTHDNLRYDSPEDAKHFAEHAVEMAKLHAWDKSFTSLFEGSKHCSAPIQRAAQILKVQYTASVIWMDSHVRRSDEEYYKYTSLFTDIIHLSRGIILDPTQAAAHQNFSTLEAGRLGSKDKYTRPDFAFDYGAMPALQLTALKCRIPRIRHQALELLKLAPRQEGVFNRTFITKLAANFIQISEVPGKDQTGSVTASPSTTAVSPRVSLHEGYGTQNSPEDSKRTMLSPFSPTQASPRALSASHASPQTTVSHSSERDRVNFLVNRGIWSNDQLSQHALELEKEKIATEPNVEHHQEFSHLQIRQQGMREGSNETLPSERGKGNAGPSDEAASMLELEEAAARDASEGAISGSKQGILGFDVTTGTYSFDVRGV